MYMLINMTSDRNGKDMLREQIM